MNATYEVVETATGRRLATCTSRGLAEGLADDYTRQGRPCLVLRRWW